MTTFFIKNGNLYSRIQLGNTEIEALLIQADTPDETGHVYSREALEHMVDTWYRARPN